MTTKNASPPPNTTTARTGEAPDVLEAMTDAEFRAHLGDMARVRMGQGHVDDAILMAEAAIRLYKAADE